MALSLNNHIHSLESTFRWARNIFGFIAISAGICLPTFVYMYCSITSYNEAAINYANFLVPEIAKDIDNTTKINDILENLRGTFPISYAAIFTENYHLVTAWNRVEGDTRFNGLIRLEENTFKITDSKLFTKVTFTGADKRTYFMQLGLDLHLCTEEINIFYAIGMILVTIISIICIYACWQYFRSTIIHPTIKLSNQVNEILKSKDLGTRLPVETEDEIGHLASNINDFLDYFSKILKITDDFCGALNSINIRINNSWDIFYANSQTMKNNFGDSTSILSNLIYSFDQVTTILDNLTANAEAGATSVKKLDNVNHIVDSGSLAMNNSANISLDSMNKLAGYIQQVNTHISQLQNELSLVNNFTANMDGWISTTNQNTSQTFNFSKELYIKAITGLNAIDQTRDNITAIQNNTAMIADVIQKLGEYATEISSVLSIIDDISRETTLLSFNANIIAVQAGNKGFGFSVIANELALMAANTEKASQQISDIIVAIQEKSKLTIAAMQEEEIAVTQGVELGTNSLDSFQQLRNAAKRTSEITKELAKNTTNSYKIAHVISNKIKDMAQVVDAINKTAANQNNSMYTLSNAANQVQESSQHINSLTTEQTTCSQNVLQSIDMIKDLRNKINDQKDQQTLLASNTSIDLRKTQSITDQTDVFAKRCSDTIKTIENEVTQLSSYVEEFKF